MEFLMKDIGFYTELPYGRLDVAGKDEAGFRPYQLMAASIAVCSGGVLRTILTKKRIEVNDIKIQTDVTRSEGQTGKIESIRIHYIIAGKQLNKTHIHKAIELAGKNCPMAQSVKGCIEIVETFELIGL